MTATHNGFAANLQHPSAAPLRKRQVDKTLYRRPAFTPDVRQLQLRQERIQALGGLTGEEILNLQENSEMLPFACMGTDRHLRAWDLFCLQEDQLQQIDQELAESIKLLTAAKVKYEAEIEKAPTLEAKGHLETALQGVKHKCYVKNVFRDVSTALRNCSRAALETATELAGDNFNRFKRLRREPEELKQQLADAQQVRPTRTFNTLKGMFDQLGAAGVIEQWSAIEFHTFLEGLQTARNFYNEGGTDSAILAAALKEDKRQSAADQLTATFAAFKSAWDAYTRTLDPFAALDLEEKSTSQDVIPSAADDEDYDEEDDCDLFTFDPEQKNRMEKYVRSIISAQQVEEDDFHVLTSHKTLQSKFKAAEEAGQWTYNDDDDHTSTNSQTMFSRRLSEVIKVMERKGHLIRVKKGSHTIKALKRF